MMGDSASVCIDAESASQAEGRGFETRRPLWNAAKWQSVLVIGD